MIAMGIRSTAERTRRIQVHSPELHGIKSEWMISDEDPSLSPTIFLVEQPAGMVLPAHFHRNNQFQLVVAGTGKIGPTKLEPVTIHYAGAYTAYGPLLAGPEGLKYFTIRPVHESGMQVVAETPQHAWPKGPRCHATSKQVAVLSDHELAQVTRLLTANAITGDGGMRADVCTLPPGSELDLFCHEEAEGLFIFVLAGSAEVEAVTLGLWESVFLSSDELTTPIRAGAGGAQVAILAPPALAPAYRT